MITITDIPHQVETNQPFSIEGTVSDDLRGEQIALTIDNQFSSLGGQVADDGSWRVEFVFLSPGNRRMTFTIGSESQTRNIEVSVTTPSLRITNIPAQIRTLESFVIEGEADDLEDGEELLIRIDRRFDVATPVVQGGRWQATLILSQGGQRLLEVIASEQERIQTNINVTTDTDIITRQVWGAPPTPSSLPNLNPRRITLHHTVNPTLSANASQATEFQRMRDTRNFHVNNRGYSDIGYHYVIMPSGRIYEGRYDRKRGAHDVINDGFGIAFDGSYHLPGSRITEAQFKSAVALCIRLCQRIGIKDPTVPVSTPTAFPGRPNKNLPRIIGHRDRFKTACPGMDKGTSIRMAEIRQAVKEALN